MPVARAQETTNQLGKINNRQVTAAVTAAAAIKKGVKVPLHKFPKPNTHRVREFPEQPEITATIGEYLQTSAIRETVADLIGNPGQPREVQPAQQVQYLGHIWDLEKNKIRPLNQKVEQAIQTVKHQMKGKVCTAKYIASAAGQLLDQAKSNVALWGLPKQLMRQAGCDG